MKKIGIPRVKAFAVTALVSCVSVAVMLARTGFYHGPGKWYTAVQPYKYQIDAFLKGHLSIFPTPFGMFFDGCWGVGVQQPWGLGVPIIELPFELLAKLFHWPAGFPDRLLFVILYAITAAFVWNVSAKIFPGRNWVDYFCRALSVALILLTNPFLRLVAGKFFPYQTAILYSCFATCFVLGFALLTLKNPLPRNLFVTAFLCGFLPVLKISYVFHGFVLVVTLLWLSRRQFTNVHRMAALAAFAAGPVFILVTNYIRFDSPWEFGYSLNINTESELYFALRFGYPFQSVSLVDAAKELLGFMFGRYSAAMPYWHDAFPWQVQVPRLRETVFSEYGAWTAVALVIAWTAPLWLKIFKRTRNFKRENDLMLLGIFGIATSIMLFVFYLRVPAMSSRYMVDFSVPFAVTLIFLMAFMMRSAGPRAAAIAGVFLVGIIAAGWKYEWSQTIDLTETVEAGQYKDRTFDENTGKGNAFPERYDCHDLFDKNGKPTRKFIGYGAIGNTGGWDLRTTCLAEVTTMLYFKDLRCFKMDFEITGRGSEPSAKYDDSFVQAKANLEFLSRKAVSHEGNSVSMTFCRVPKAVEKERTPFSMVTIKWVDIPDMLVNPPVRLISVVKIPSP